MINIITFLLLFIGGDQDDLVHHPKRLKILEPSKQISGRVMSITGAADGDYHINLRIQDTSLLFTNNVKKENNCLVVEVICAKKSIFRICKDHTNLIPIPSIGDSIEVVGPYVYDKWHGLAEIHPVKELKIITNK
jgi:hypothetical protein